MAFILRDEKEENTEFWLEVASDGGIVLRCLKTGAPHPQGLAVLKITEDGMLELLRAGGFSKMDLKYNLNHCIMVRGSS